MFIGTFSSSFVGDLFAPVSPDCAFDGLGDSNWLIFYLSALSPLVHIFLSSSKSACDSRKSLLSF